MNTESVKGQQFPNSAGLKVSGKAGDWYHDVDNGEFYIRIPDGTKRGQLRMFPYSTPEWPCEAGDQCWNWDGDPASPTLTPSLHITNVWHGWFRNGELISE